MVTEALGSVYAKIADECQMISLALKALTHVVHREEPSPEDVQRLQALMPEMTNRPVDMLACAIVKKVTAGK